MASIYDNIKTAKELVETVSVHGLSTKTEDICRAQDIFGRSALRELVELANDNGRQNEKGEPDPNGSWSSGKTGTRNVFYQILFHIWSWEDAVRFFNLNSNDDYRLAKEGRNNLKEENEDLLKKIERLEKEQERRATVFEETVKKMSEANCRATKAESEIVRLKAKLYDLMTGEGDEENGER